MTAHHFRGVHRDDLPIHQHGDAVRQIEDHVHVVFDHHQGAPFTDAAHERNHALGLGTTHPCGRFVQQHAARVAHHRHADFQQTLIGVAQVAGRCVFARTQLKHFQQFVHLVRQRAMM